MGTIRTLMLGLPLEEATFDRRGFPPCRERARLRLETVGKTFLTGYLAALRHADHETLVRELEGVELERRGFAYEGAAMALGLCDILFPWKRNRWSSFTESAAGQHVYMMNVGLGWALARMRMRPGRHLERLDPLIRWLVLDGYGFHECYFKWREVMVEGKRPKRLEGYELNAFDQGVGRALWFVNGADPIRIAGVLDHLPEERRADIWSGIGLAAAYAGGLDEERLEMLATLSGSYRPAMSQGVLFATETRIKAGNLATHTTLACRVVAGITADVASRIVNGERTDLQYGGPVPAYEHWRRRIQAHFIPGTSQDARAALDAREAEYHNRR